MELTSLPSESLYKFMAFAGLVIIFTSSAYYFKYYMSITARLINIVADMKIFKVKIELSTSEMKLDTSQLDRFIDTASFDEEILLEKIASIKEKMKEGISDEERDVLAKEYKSYGEQVDSVLDKMSKNHSKSMEIWSKHREQHLGIQTDNIRLDEKDALLSLDSKHLKYLNISYILALVLGIWLSVYGFNRWFTIQAYIDQAIIKEALKK